MSFISKFFGLDDLTATVRESNIRLDAVTQSVKETPEIIQAAISSALQKSELQGALDVTRRQLESVDSSLKSAAVCPIPVQTFPVTDDFRFEKEKKQAALESAKRFVAVGGGFIEKLNVAHRPVDNKMERFFSLIDQHVKNGSKAKGEALDQALNELLDCSPKRVITAFQKHSLEAGVAFVQHFNRIINELAHQFPRCRSGIYNSRLNYSDVIQFSDEIIATLRATSTALDDVQRRHDLLEALQGELLSDLNSNEINLIWDAIKSSFSDAVSGMVDKDDSWWNKLWKAPIGVGVGSVAWAMAIVSAPQAQFQGQLARIHRVKVFIATSLLLRDGWAKWSHMNEEIVIPNLKVMFDLKCNFIENRILSITDLIGTNGYPLDRLPSIIESSMNKKS